VILSELKSTDTLHLLADKVTQGDIPAGLMQTALRTRYAKRSMEGTLKMKEISRLLEASPSTAAVIKLGTWSSAPPRQHNTHFQNLHNKQQTRVRQNSFCFVQKGTQPNQNVLKDTSHQTRQKVDASDASQV
jgi:hypothetical protein